MASAVITFKNDNTGEVKPAPVGFSWTALFFGFIPMLCRSDWKGAAIVFFVYCIAYIVVSQFAPRPEGVVSWSGLIFGIIYNKLYIKELISKGYSAVSVNKGELKDVIAKLGIDIPVDFDGEPQTPNQVEGKVVEATLGHETELQSIDDMYEKSLINDEERKAMRKKVLGLG